jgi:hypothetical protein
MYYLSTRVSSDFPMKDMPFGDHHVLTDGMSAPFQGALVERRADGIVYLVGSKTQFTNNDGAYRVREVLINENFKVVK